MKKTKILITLLIFFTVASLFFVMSRQKKGKPLESRLSYFKPVSIEKYSNQNSPLFFAQIEDRKILVMLDLGFMGGLTVTPSLIEEIKEKKFMHSIDMFGFHGKKYLQNFYLIPKIEIGDSTFSDIGMQDGHTEEFLKDSLLVQNKNNSITEEEGAIGWEMFQKSNLFLDLKNSQMAFCDSLETLQEHGYFLESFAKTPLLLENGIVEIEAATAPGNLRCWLDTGSTCNMINRDVALEEFDLKKVELFSLFKLGNLDFGPIAFHPLSIHLPFPIEATLGMEFFSKHVVFLDFKNLQAYFYRHSGISNTIQKN